MLQNITITIYVLQLRKWMLQSHVSVP